MSWFTKRNKDKEICKELERNSVSQLEEMISAIDRDYYTRYYTKYPDARTKFHPPGVVWQCIIYLKENSKKVNKIIKKHHNDVATMVYSLGVVVGNQLIQSGTVNSMTAVYTLLMYLAKVGLDKVLSDSKDSPDDTSDEGKGDTK